MKMKTKFGINHLNTYILSALLILLVASPVFHFTFFFDGILVGQQFIISFICIICSLFIWSTNLKTEIHYSVFDISIGCFLLYIGIHFFFFPNPYSITSDYLYFINIVFCSFLIKQSLKNKQALSDFLKYGIALVFISQVSLGVYQLLDLKLQIPNIDIKGSFDNSGIYSLFLTIHLLILPIFLRSTKTIVRLVALVFALFGLILIVLVGSRTAWLALLSGSFLILLNTYRYFLTKVIQANWKYPVAFFTGIVLCLKYLYSFKQDSADGRMLIWKSTLLLIRDSPLFGNGFGAFGARYNFYQATYFSINRNSQFENLAANSKVAFNEFLQITADFGIIGLLLFLFVIYQFFRGCLGLPYPYKIYSISIGIVFLISFSFSYPFRSVNLHGLLIVALPLLTFLFQSKKISVGKYLKIGLLFCLCLGLVFNGMWIFKQVKARIMWNNAFEAVLENDYDNAVRLCKKIENLEHDPNFLYFYGSVLLEKQDPQLALTVFKKAELFMADNDLYLNIGDCYALMGNKTMAINYYRLSNMVVPHKLLPKFKLFELYIKSGDFVNGYAIAKEIDTMPVKVNSAVVEYIKESINTWLKSHTRRSIK